MNININININMNMNMNMNNHHHHHHHHQIITQEDAEELILLFPTTEAKRPAAKASKTQQVQQYRSRHGMTKSGYVLRTTPVVFDIPMHHCHPFVHSIGRNFVRSFPSHIHNELTMLEQYMDKVLTKQREFGDRKQYQYNLGLRIVPAKRKRGSASTSTPPRQLPSTASSVASISSSGTILRESTLRLGYPDLYNSLIETLGAAIQEAYGKQPWFKRMKALCRNLRQQTGQDRTFPNMPVSTIRRLSHVRDGPPIQIEARDDPHCVGPGFVIATYPNENNEFEMICLATDNNNDNNNNNNNAATGETNTNRTRTVVHAPKPSTVHAGAWDSDPPSFRFRSEAQSQSQSQSQVPNFWVLYLDGRVFSSRYTMGGGY